MQLVSIGTLLAYSFLSSVVLLSRSVFVAPWAVAHQAPLSMGLSRQDPWGGLPGLPPGGMRPASLTSPVSAGVFFTTSDPWKAKTRIPVIHVC